jgi:hypothetical protein
MFQEKMAATAITAATAIMATAIAKRKRPANENLLGLWKDSAPIEPQML